MSVSNKAQWHHVEAVRDLDGVVDVEWENPLYVVIHKDVRIEVFRVLGREGHFGDVTFEEIPDDPDAVIDYQAQSLNNFDLLLIPSSRRHDLGDFVTTINDDYDHHLWNAVDLVMSEQGVATEQIQTLRQRGDDDPVYRNILLPLFRALRKRGFKASTLRG